MSLTKEQQRIFQWIKSELELPGFAVVFKGAAVNLKLKSSGYITFVAHAGRDIMNGLAFEYKGKQRKRVSYKEDVDKVEEVWNDKWGRPAGSFDEEEPLSYEIPNEVCKKVKALIDNHKAGRERSEFANRFFFATFLDYDDIENIPNNFEAEWKNTKEWFLKHTHIRRSKYEAKMEKEIVEHFHTLETYLYIAACSRFEQTQELNEILEQANK